MICSLDIRKDIIDDVSQKLSDKGATIEGNVGFFPNPRKADDAINSINKEFEDLVVKAGEKGSFTIDPSDALIDKYLSANKEFEQTQALSDAVDLQQEEIERGGYTEEDRGEFYQLRNIFNSLDELHLKLRNINKTPNSIGSDSKMIDVLKKAGLDVNQRTQFIKLVTDNPELKELKLSTILDSYLKEFVKDSDKVYYNAIDEPLSKELEDTLINYFDKFHIKREQLDNLKDKFGVDSVGVFDVLAKTIYYAKNRNLLTLPEEYGHVFVELLGTVAKDKAENKLFSYLSNNIEKWDGYARVFEDYKNQYVTAEGFIDAEKIKKEAIGQAIGIALVSNYKNNKNANQSFWNKLLDSNKDFWTKVQEVIDHLYSLLGKMDYVNINLEIDKIAKDIISKNYSKLDRVQKNTSNYNLLSYSETIEQQNKKDGGLALSFMQWFSEIGNIITGSLSYRLQGNTYRPEIDALHDIDMMVGSDIHKIDLKKSAYLSPEELERDRLYRKNISEGNFREANKYKMQGNVKIDLAEIENSEYFKKVKEKYPDLDLLYTYVKPGTSNYFVTVNAVWSKQQDLKDKFKSLSGNFNSRLTKFTKEEIDQMYLFDFFLMPETSEKYLTVEDKEYGLRLDHFASSFYAKLLGMGRPKDAYDYQNWELLDETNNIAPDLKDRLLYFQLQQSIKDNPQFQLEDMEMSKSSPETLAKIKEACKKMGINIQDLADYAKSTGLDTKTINGVADLVKGIVAIAEGREDVALTEEMVHLATAILEQTNPKMVTEMIAKIDRFQIYKKVFDLYKNNKNYQLPNGKPDIRKIKKEAVDKLIAEVIINQNEGDTEFPELMSEINQSTISSWWNTIIDKIRGMYKASNISIFETVASKIVDGSTIGTVDDIKGEGTFYQVVSDKQQDIQQKLQATKDSITKIEASAKDKNDPLLLDSEEANNYYAIKQADGTTKKIVNRVTDRVKAWYEKRFKGKTFTEKEQAFNELKRTYGVAGHKDFEEIHARYFNADGTRRSKPLPQPRKFNLENKEMYQLLENYYVDLINSFPNKGKDCLFFSEVIIYDDKYKEGEAGTIDLLVVEPSGKAHIFDWKFMNIPGTTDDVAWFKQNAFGIQLGRYKEILKNKYGVKEFGMIRAIPIVMDFVKSTKKVDAPYRLKGLAVGSVDSKQITDLRLMPVSEETESTGLESLDETIRDLNSILVQVGKEKVSGEEELEFKIERLNTIRKAIRIVQGTQNIQPLVDVIKVLRKDGAKIVNDYNVIYKDKVATLDSVNDPDLSKFSSEMKNYIDIAKAFEYIDTKIGKLIYNDSMISTAKTKAQKKELEERRELRNNLREEVRQITESRIEIDKQGGIMGKFADKFIGQRHLVEGLEKPETVIKGLSSFFRGVSDLGSAALDLLYKITNLAKGKAMQESLTEVTELMKIRENIVKKGGDVRKYIQKIYQKDTKGDLVNKLVHKYKSEFYDKVRDLSGEKDDKQWLLDNLNIDAYKEEALKVMNTNIEIIEKTNYEGENEYEDEMIRDEKILEQKQKWDISRKDFNGWNNFVIYKHPNDNWKSNEYKAIESDKNLLALYDFIIKFNKKAKDMGYINAKVSTVFLPFIRKSMAESIAWDHSLSPISNFSKNLKIKLDDVGFGSFNEFTGEIENSIPKYYTYDFTYKDGVNDYSDVSEDIFKNLILYVQHANKYKYLSEVEDQLKIVKIIEEGKGHLATASGGNIIKDEFGKEKVIRNNDENSALFNNFLKVLMYDQKYVLSDADTPMYINKVLNPIKKIINYIPKQVTGKDLWEEGDVSTGLSMVKTIDAANKAFQIKTLGLDIIPGAVNWFGGNIQVLTQAGEYFSGKEYWSNETKLIGQKFKNKDERKEFAELINLFMPLKDDPSYELYKDAGLTTLTRNDFTDMLMVFMRKPEQLIEKSIFLSLLDNMMVDNGKIISIKEFVKNKYPDRSKSGTIYRETQAKMKKEVEELKKTRSISATKKLENGKLVIPGLDLTNRNELQRLTSLTRRISRNATGGLSDGDINKMSMSIWTKSMMLFKGWVPKLTDTRFSEFRKTNDDFSIRVNSKGELEGYKYDVGRLRVLAYFFQLNLFKTVGRINDTIAMNDAGVEEMTKMFEEYRENYEKRTGEVLQMSREDFVDLIRQNLSNQMRELGILVSIMGAAISLGFMAPPPEADKSTKNAFRFAQRTLDKFESELSFFYNPANYEALVGGGMFPALGIVTDFQRFMTNFWLETTGFNLSDPTKTMDEVREKAQPIKYLMKMLPVTKSVLVYLAILNSDFAKEYDITVQKETSRR